MKKDLTKTSAMYQRAKLIIPTGTQLMSKRPELYCEGYPAYYRNANGCEVTDLDGNKYFDFGNMNLGANILGYQDPDVDNAVKQVIAHGNMSSLNSALEVELAEKLIEIHKWAGGVRYAKTGGEAMAIAVRIARAYTGKEIVLFCGYHGWHDWYACAGPEGISKSGVPKGLESTALPFIFNDIQDLNRIEKLIKLFEAENNIAAIILEPMRYEKPTAEFINKINELRNKYKCVLILDEITSGFRFNLGGVHLNLDIKPDIAVFGKAMSNGYPQSAIIGTKQVMKAAKKCFISSTYWTDAIGLAASLATIDKMQNFRFNNLGHVHGAIFTFGVVIGNYWIKYSKKYDLEIEIIGRCELLCFKFKKNHQAMKTLFTKLMLEEGFLAYDHFYPSLAHEYYYCNKYGKALDKVFCKMRKIMDSGKIDIKPCQKSFRRYT
jgi:glutamate-1-semialdehyde 2,1-aminomutase